MENWFRIFVSVTRPVLVVKVPANFDGGVFCACGQYPPAILRRCFNWLPVHYILPCDLDTVPHSIDPKAALPISDRLLFDGVASELGLAKVAQLGRHGRRRVAGSLADFLKGAPVPIVHKAIDAPDLARQALMVEFRVIDRPIETGGRYRVGVKEVVHFESFR